MDELREYIIKVNVNGKLADECLNVLSAKELVRCKDCKHRPKERGFDLEFPEGSKCPCRCSDDEYFSWYPPDDWFCANGERE